MQKVCRVWVSEVISVEFCFECVKERFKLKVSVILLIGLEVSAVINLVGWLILIRLRY